MADFLAGGGKTGALMRSLDWSTSPLGAPSGWPASLRTVVALLLDSRFPMFVAWGNELGFIYNDAYAELLGRKHPAALGARFHDVWAEIWADIAPLIDAALAGEASYHENLPLLVQRGEAEEQAWFTFSYSPVRDESGHVRGMFCAVTETTETVLAERAVRESEARFRTMADHAPVMMWVTDPSGRCTYLNQRWYEFTGQPPRAGEGEGWLEAIHPDDRPAAAQAFHAANAARRDYRVEFRLRRADGAYRWTIDAAAARLDEAGRFLGYIGTVIDIDERKDMEDALRRSEARLRDLNETLEGRVEEAIAERTVLADILEATDASVQMLDPELRFLAINAAAQASYQLSYGVRPVVGQSLAEVLAHMPVERAAAERAWRRVLDGGAYSEIAWWGGGDFERRAFEMRFQPFIGGDGRCIGAYQFGRDITERLLEQERLAVAEAARREADALYRAYFEHTAEALFVVNVLADGGFSIADLNPAHQASIGLPLAEVMGKRIDEVLPPETAAPVQDHYRRALAAESVYQYREHFELNGRMTYWDTVLVPVRDADGRIVRLIGSSRDLTQQMLAEEQLRQSQKLEAMGSLVGGVAHDVNNLLSPIVGGLDLLQRRGIADERAARLLDNAMQAAERARILVQRLLAFARRQPLRPVPVDLGKLVTEMADLVASTSGPRVHVDVEIAPALPAVQADANQIEMAILNLSVNSRDAMPSGGNLTIAVTPEAVDAQHRTKLPPATYVRLAVSDTGTGMDEVTARRAIEPFFSTKGVGQGTGLGLSMAHGLAGQLGGALTISSRPGLGTTVELWLPIAAAPEPAPEKPRAPEPIVAAGAALVIDDEELVRTSTAEMLAELGYAVVEAASGEAALRHLADGLRPELIVTDHLMPGMTGVELARRVRSLQPEAAVLIVSGYADVEGIAPDLARLEKPFKQHDLAAAVAELVSPASQRTPAPAG